MTLDGLPLALANGIGVVGVVLAAGWLVMTGRLIPKATHDREIAYLTQRIEDEQHSTGEWRTEARLREQANGELIEQNREVLHALGPTLTDFLSSLRRAGVGPSNGEGDEP